MLPWSKGHHHDAHRRQPFPVAGDRRAKRPVPALLLMTTMSCAIAFADEESPSSVTVAVGERMKIALPPHPIHNLDCDDLRVVRARLLNEKRSLFVEIVGRALGTTTCGIRYLGYPATVIKIAVVPAKRDLLRRGAFLIDQ